jgi:hypothetical protein
MIFHRNKDKKRVIKIWFAILVYNNFYKRIYMKFLMADNISVNPIRVIVEDRVPFGERLKLSGLRVVSGDSWMSYYSEGNSENVYWSVYACNNSRFGNVEFDDSGRVVPQYSRKIVDLEGKIHIIDILGGNKQYLDIRYTQEVFPRR